jgi:hypothetical protein
MSVLIAPSLRSRIAYLIHRGCTEIRTLASHSGDYQEIANLADILEWVPRFLGDEPSDAAWEAICEQFVNHAKKYPKSGERLVRYLSEPIPDRY